ncbi:MAG: hypothetical protein U5R31_11700 [Acidimicrobiia bacterium]|nr:hypothetical protein [Acidimicrobiia bacterium]
MLVISGDQDPVGGFGEGVRALEARYAELGVDDLTVRLYEGARHELLNETNRDEVTDDLVGWLRDRCPREGLNGSGPPSGVRIADHGT